MDIVAQEPAPAIPGARPEPSTEIVATFEGLERLGREWAELWRRACFATPFTHPAWLLAWCRHLSSGAPHAVAAWRGNDLVGLAPALVYDGPYGRTAGLLGGGVSDYQDLLAEDAAVARALLDRLRDDPGIDAVELRSLPGRSPALGALAPDEAHECGVEAVCPVLALPACVDDLAGRVSPRLLDDVRYQRRRLAREGGLSVRRATAETLEERLDDLFRLHAARWRARGEAGLLTGPALKGFHRAAARGLLEAGVLRLFTLRAGGATLAALYGFQAGSRAYVYLHGIDPGHARRSPGSLVMAQAIEDAIAEGAAEFDFLRGEEGYKARWGAVAEQTFRVLLSRDPRDAGAAIPSKS